MIYNKNIDDKNIDDKNIDDHNYNDKEIPPITYDDSNRAIKCVKYSVCGFLCALLLISFGSLAGIIHFGYR